MNTCTFDFRDRLSYTPQAIVLAQGDYPSDAGLRKMIEEVPHLIVCDGAVRGLLEHSSRSPDCVIGDGDSVPMARLEELGIPFVHVQNQNTNDLTKAIMLCKDNGWMRVCILGGTGRREDHTLGNISLLCEYHMLGMEVRMMSDYGTFLPFEGDCTLTVEVGQQLSLFNLGGAHLSASGVKYPFERTNFAALWQATLNEAVAEEVHLSADRLILIYIAQERKDPQNTTPC